MTRIEDEVARLWREFRAYPCLQSHQAPCQYCTDFVAKIATALAQVAQASRREERKAVAEILQQFIFIDKNRHRQGEPPYNWTCQACGSVWPCYFIKAKQIVDEVDAIRQEPPDA